MGVLSDKVREYKAKIKTIKNDHQLETLGVAGAGVTFGMVIGYVLGVILMASQIPVTKSKSETTETQSD
jgi:Na+/glutamate symporter